MEGSVSTRSLYEGLDRRPFIPDYFFHKGGMINFTRFVASYYGPAKVRCNCGQSRGNPDPAGHG